MPAAGKPIARSLTCAVRYASSAEEGGFCEFLRLIVSADDVYHRQVPRERCPARGVNEDDRRLVARMRAGEQSAFDAFFAAYAQRLAAFVGRRSRLDPAGVEDMVQNSLIKAIRHLEGFRGEAALFTWLCKICRHELASLHRKEARQPIHESADVAGSRARCAP